jgi:hypothetical protein
MIPGDFLPSKIREAIEKASVFCVVVSTKSNRSEWVPKEIDEALRQNSRNHFG